MQRHHKLSWYLLLIIVLASTLLLATHTGARASSASITLSVPSGPPTSYFKVTGTGFGASEQVIILFDTTQVGTGKTDNAGTFVKSLRVPASATPGSHTVQATGQTSGLTASTTFLVQTNWPMFGFGPDHSHFNRFENVLNTGNVGNLALQWQTIIGGNLGGTSPIVANGLLYITTCCGISNNMLYALSLTSHAIVWSDTFTHAAITTPIVANGVVYVGADRLYALNAQTGAVIWQSTTFRYLSSLVLGNGLLYFNSDHKYCAFTLAGQPRWCDRFAGEGTAAISGNVLYEVTAGGGALYALDGNNGHLLWSYPTGNIISEDSPSVVNGIVYFTGSTSQYNSTLYALNAISGALIWSYAIPSFTLASPAIANGLLYIASSSPDDTLYALNAVTGQFLWQFSAQSFVDSPSLANGVLYIDGYGTLDALDAKTGAFLWSANVESALDVIVANGMIYVAGGAYPNTGIYAFGLSG